MESQVVMLVDFDYFYAQVEEVRNPSLKDKPVVICVYSGRSENSGAVATANYIARRYGVKSGIPIYLAKKKLKDTDAVFLPVDHEFYRHVAERIMQILRSQADHFEQVGIDEAYIDVSERASGSFEDARELAFKIKEEISNLEKITCSIGIGPNKLIAKIAADLQKPNGLIVVKPFEVENFLRDLPVGRLIGVGKKTEVKMETLGIRTIGDLARQDVQRLIKVFGRTTGTYLRHASLGIDESPVQERGEAESISKIATLKENTRELKMIIERTDRMCSEIHARLAEQGRRFKTAGVIAIMTDLTIHSRSKTLESPTDDLMTLKMATKELFARILVESELELRRAGVRVSNLTKAKEKQKQITNYFNT